MHHLTSFLHKTNQSCADSFILEVQVVIIGVGAQKLLSDWTANAKCKRSQVDSNTRKVQDYIKKLGTNNVGTLVKTLKITWRK